MLLDVRSRPGSRCWVPWFEKAFAHYDMDGDGLSEIVARLASKPGQASDLTDFLRLSFDADNDNDWLNRRDFDFSLNCEGPVALPEAVSEPLCLRNGTFTAAKLRWDKIIPAVLRAKWSRCTLAWDEIDDNVNPANPVDRVQERWEGVGGYRGSISYGNLGEPNKRWEEDQDASGEIGIYYSPVDRRIHLRGAEKGALNLDYDRDGKIDGRLLYEDRDADGYFDTWSYTNASGGIVRSYHSDSRPFVVERDYTAITRVFTAGLSDALKQNQELIDVMQLALGSAGQSRSRDWYLHECSVSTYQSEKMLWSREATRLYQDYIREELFTNLLAAGASGTLKLNQPKLEDLYAQGEFASAARLIRENLGQSIPESEPWFDRAAQRSASACGSG